MKFHSTYEFMYNCNGFIAVNQTIKVIGCLLFHNVVGYKSWLECFYASKYITTITHRQLCNTLSIRFLSFLNAFKQVLEASFRKMYLDCFKCLVSHYSSNLSFYFKNIWDIKKSKWKIPPGSLGGWWDQNLTLSDSLT